MVGNNTSILVKTIARIDFLSPQSTLQKELPASLSKLCIKLFPIPEPKDVILKEVSFSPPGKDVPTAKDISLKEWHFFGKQREKHLYLDHTAMFIEFLKYESFDDFKEYFFSISDALYDSFKDLQVMRLGLRYINNIEFPGKNVFYWNPYLNSNLLAIFKIPQDKSKITRAFHNLEMNFGDYNIRFQYGMNNPDYPAPIKKRFFVLDYDAYTTGSLEKEDIHQLLPIFHSEIKRLFDKSVTNKLKS